MASKCLLISFLVATTMMSLVVSSEGYDFLVGGRNGWVLNPSEGYSQWASRNRFQVNDSLVFKYSSGTDSVLEVNKAAYDSCNTTSPITKLEGGDSRFKFPRSGPFYFITGNQTNCQSGQKLLVVVMSPRTPRTPTSPPPPSTPTPSPTPAPSTTPASPTPAPASLTPAPAPESETPTSTPAPAPESDTPAPASLAPGPSSGGGSGEGPTAEGPGAQGPSGSGGSGGGGSDSPPGSKSSSPALKSSMGVASVLVILVLGIAS